MMMESAMAPEAVAPTLAPYSDGHLYIHLQPDSILPEAAAVDRRHMKAVG